MSEERKAAAFDHYMNNSEEDNGVNSEGLYKTAVNAIRNQNNPFPQVNMIDRPSHYTQYEGFEVMDVCRQLNSPDGKGQWFRSNVFKYLARAGWKERGSLIKEIEDLKKAAHYLQREIDRLEVKAQADDAERSQGWMAVGADPEPAVEPRPWRDLTNEQQAEVTRRFETTRGSIPIPVQRPAMGVVSVLPAVAAQLPQCPTCNSELQQNPEHNFELECMNPMCECVSDAD